MRYGNGRSVTVTPTIDTGIHTAADVVVGPTVVSLAGSATGGGVLKQVALADADNEKAALTLLFFKALPTGTWTPNAAPVPSDADRLNFLGKVEIAAADYVTAGSDAFACVEASLQIRGNDIRNAYFVALCSGTPTYTAADDLDFTFGILMD